MLNFKDAMKAYKSRISSEEEGLDILNLSERYASMKEKRWAFVENVQKDPVFRHPLPPTMYRDLSWDRWGCHPLWRVYDAAKKRDGKVRKRLEDFTASQIQSLSNHARLMISILDGKEKPITLNANFTQSQNGWKINNNGKGKVIRKNDGYNDPGSLYGKGLTNCVVEQKVPVTNRAYTCLGFVKVPKSNEFKGRIELQITVLDANGESLGSQNNPVKTLPGIWMPMTTSIDIPALKSDKEPKSMIIQLRMSRFDPESEFFVDNLGLFAHEQ